MMNSIENRMFSMEQTFKAELERTAQLNSSKHEAFLACLPDLIQEPLQVHRVTGQEVKRISSQVSSRGHNPGHLQSQVGALSRQSESQKYCSEIAGLKAELRQLQAKVEALCYDKGSLAFQCSELSKENRELLRENRRLKALERENSRKTSVLGSMISKIQITPEE
jgi:predicted RNase H-like nuclease (RuvC/YqgF family)